MFYKEESSKKENEGNEVKIFLENSMEFQKMKVIANKPGMEDAKRHISYLEQCKSFYELKQACSDKGDIENNDNIVVYNMGRNNVNTMLYAFGFFSDHANFTYYELHLYESITYSGPRL
ncbi:hypothetical protein LEAN103870_00755 [Legionella anisa]|uniref:Uncharacterized protein n=1 Tax=Legionella anisa TaxID=28082 RepID=A0AAX0WVZ0_9GAMM|nr:hypothetical protein [Legionella anisa]AWN73885.1 hypothetical protein DLD14_08595 [Legionella anisa]KTC67153.1 hypothetical protein Lani_3498 [Legionella anisa]MBN5937301.1 hypothetical protein [Legionella anisa]MCW8426149.1 hypothetical protein [Legionella anisa]MCW8448460.1 hypothetical protein [Legionella anisa]